jgi:hypothetical protein
MADMRDPYAHIAQEIERLKYRAKEARLEIIKLTVTAEIFEQSERSLSQVLHDQAEADADREMAK